MADHHLTRNVSEGHMSVTSQIGDDHGGGDASAVVAVGDSGLAGYDPSVFSKVFVISGTLITLSHAEVRAALEKRGAIFSRRISKKVDYFICGQQPGAAAVTARLYDIPTLTENDLLELLGIKKQLTLDFF